VHADLLGIIDANSRGARVDRNGEWAVLIQELNNSLDIMSRALASAGVSVAEIEDCIRKRYCALHNRGTIAEAFGKYGLVKKWDAITTYAMLVTTPSILPRQIGSTAAYSVSR
jgi:hypothetical protein